MKRLAVWLIAAAFALSMALPQGTVLAKAGNPTLLVDGVEVGGYEQVFTSHGQLLLPVESVFSEAGFYVSKEGKATTATNGYLTVVFNPAEESILVNGKKSEQEFPLTLRNGGNYIPLSFLDKLDGFEAAVAENGQLVEVETNRVKDVDGFLEKTVTAELKSYSANMDIEQTVSADEFGSMAMNMNMAMDMIQDPLSMYTTSEMEMTMDEETMVTRSEGYLTEQGFFQNDGDGWFKFDEGFVDGILGSTTAQADPFAQLEMMKEFLSSVNVFEYGDKYVLTYTVSDENFNKLLSSLLGDFAGLLEGSLSGEGEEVEADLEESALDTVAEAALRAEDELSGEELTEEFEGEFSEDELEGIIDSLSLKIEEFYAVTTIDKKTLFPVDVSSRMKMTMTVDEEEIVTRQVMKGTYSNFNAVKPIVVPEEVVKNAKSFEEYLAEMEEELEIE